MDFKHIIKCVTSFGRVLILFGHDSEQVSQPHTCMKLQVVAHELDNSKDKEI